MVIYFIEHDSPRFPFFDQYLQLLPKSDYKIKKLCVEHFDSVTYGV